METIYVETAIREHPRALEVLGRFPRATVIECQRYGEVFNVGAQNFRLQKRRPSLILAQKHGKTVLPTPPGYSIGPKRGFYFSHMLNCLYDCRYCFLQGMYRSAHYVFFVNFETFESGIDEAMQSSTEDVSFFSGYDCDSLAMEGLTGFASRFVPFFAERPGAVLELRTKSLATRVLEQSSPVPNIVVAYTLTPDPIARAVEHGAPTLASRLKRVGSLAKQGWPIGLRLDPLVPWPGFKELYSAMIEQIFSAVAPSCVHSATLGPMRFPKAMFEQIVKLYPYDPLFAREEMELRDEGLVTYSPEMELEMTEHVVESLSRHLPSSRIHRQAD